MEDTIFLTREDISMLARELFDIASRVCVEEISGNSGIYILNVAGDNSSSEMIRLKAFLKNRKKNKRTSTF